MSGTTIWRVDGSNNFLCTLGHISAGGTAACGPGNAFTAQGSAGFGTDGLLFTSTLSATATPALNGILVECFGPASSVDPGNRVGDSTIQIRGRVIPCVHVAVQGQI